ncbi:MAG: hypothetical protein AAFP19_01155, partial [Bacteroidota bacterium]
IPLSTSAPNSNHMPTEWYQILVTNYSLLYSGISVVGSQPVDISTHLTHGGRGLFFGPNRKRHLFTHETVLVPYSYDSETGKYVSGGFLGGDSTPYIALSPFTTWKLSLQNLSSFTFEDKVTITIGFKGYFYPY